MCSTGGTRFATSVTLTLLRLNIVQWQKGKCSGERFQNQREWGRREHAADNRSQDGGLGLVPVHGQECCWDDASEGPGHGAESTGEVQPRTPRTDHSAQGRPKECWVSSSSAIPFFLKILLENPLLLLYRCLSLFLDYAYWYCSQKFLENLETEKDFDLRNVWSTAREHNMFRPGMRREESMPPPSTEAPKLSSQLQNMSLIEGQAAVFDCKFSPANDPNLKIAWLHNGKGILASSRVNTMADFGYAVLEINPVAVMDRGEYTVVVVNQLGEARQSVTLEVAGIISC